MRNVFIMISNILKVAYRKKGNIVIFVVLPLASVLLSMWMNSGTKDTVLNLGFVNQDRGAISYKLQENIEVSGNYSIVDMNEEDIHESILNGKVSAGIIIPQGYTEGILRGAPETVEIVSLKGQEITAWIQQLIVNFNNNALILATGIEDAADFDNNYTNFTENMLELNVETVENMRSSKNITVSSIGFLIMFMMIGNSLIALFILNDKRDRTYYRICSAPVTSRQYIGANALSSLIIITFQVILIISTMKYVLRVDTGVSDVMMFVILELFGLVTIGIGLVITAFSESSQVAGSISTLVMTPTCMLGGCYWSIDFMPEFMQKISYFVPQRWALEAVEKLQDGGGLQSISINLVVLFAFALALMLTASYRFAKVENLQNFV